MLRNRMARLAPVSRTALISLGLGLTGCHEHGAPQKNGPAGPPEASALGVFDPAGIGPGAPPPAPPARPLEVLDYGPIGRTEGGEIHVRFNQPVVALDLPPDGGLEGLFAFDPPLQGRASWKTPDLLVFEPDELLRDCHGYTATFTGGIVGLDGQRFDRKLQWQFETVRPTVSGSHPEAGAVDHLRDAPVLIQFDRPVALAEVKAHVEATARSLATPDAAPRPVPVQARPATRKEIEQAFYYYGEDERRQIYAVVPRGPWPGDSEIVVSVTTGLRSEAGPLPLDTPWSTAVQTIRPQAIEESSCAPETPCGLEPITLKLRNPVREKQIQRITVTPKPELLRVSSWDDWGEGGREVTIEGVFEPGTEYTIRVPKDLRDVYGQSVGGSGEVKALIAPKATVALSTQDGILMSTGAQTIGVESRHVRSLRVRVGVLAEADLRGLRTAELATAAFPARFVERTIALSPTGKGDWSSLALDLAELSGGARRPLLVEVAAAELVPRAIPYGVPTPVRALVRLTDLGPLATASLPASSVQVMRLSSGLPVAGVQVFHHDARGALISLGATGEGGLLTLPHGLVRVHDDHPGQPPLRLLFADPARDDHTFLDVDDVWISGGGGDKERPSPLRPGERLITRMVSERGVYRPGEKVRVVGWSALDTPFSRSTLAHLPEGTPVTFELRDPEDRVVSVGTMKTTAEGKFWAELPVPAEARLGRYRARASLAGGTVEASVKVEDYRVPEFAVEARAQRSDLLAGEETSIDVDASYYFGGPVQIQQVTSRTDCVPRAYRPPGLEDIWTVGAPIERYSRSGGARVVEALADPKPSGRVTLPSRGTVERVRDPHHCDVAVEVQDASLQGIGAEAEFLIHPAAFYLAVALPRGWHEVGERGVSLPVRAVDFAGARVAVSGVDVEVTRHYREESFRTGPDGERIYTGMVDRTEAIKTCRLDAPASGDDPGCPLPPLKEGRHEVTLVGREPGDQPREARTVGGFHVWPKRTYTNWRGGSIDRLEVRTSSEQVRPGDTLEVAVRGPWPGAHGNLVLAHGGVRESRPFVLVDREASFEFRVDDSWTPEVTLLASVVTLPEGSGHPRVERAAARVKQEFEHRRLAVSVDAPAKAGPGDSIDIGVHVRDDQGFPSAARVALWAVDEAVLALTEYQVPDLLPSFVPRRGDETVQRDDYRALLWPFVPTAEDPWFDISGGGGLGLSGYGAGGGGSGSGSGYGRGAGGAAGPPPARSKFETTPVFLADLAVDASGDVRVQAQMPENLTTFRITAIASGNLVDGASPGRFGTNDARTMVTAPLVLRSALPRQLRPGDEAEFAAIVQNYTGAPGRVEVAAKVVQGTGANGQALEIVSVPTATAELAVGGQARLPFRAVARGPGAPEVELQATFTPTGGGPPVYDGMRVPVPVEPERTLTERVATYGDLADDRPVALPIKIPRDVLPGHGGVTVAATSTLMGGLQDAVKDLLDYPYGCVEQTSSRLLPLVALGELGATYPLEIGDPGQFVRAGVERLLTMQTREGGFGYWPGASEVHVYASAYATWVLHLAKQAGHDVPEDALKKALDDLERRFGGLTLAGVPVDWNDGAGARAAIGVHVLAEAGRDVGESVAELYARRQSLPLFARAFLLMAMHRQDPQGNEVHALAAELRGALQELQGTAHAVEQSTWGLDEYFSSDGRSDAIVLMALLRVSPDDPVIVKLARGLLERRIGGAWRNTQENAYALVALAAYARVYEAETPDFTARAWVGGAPVLDHAFAGRGVKGQTATVEMAKILDLSQKTAADTLPVILQREGQGRMYYRLGAEWAPAAVDLPARAQGLQLTRALRSEAGAVAAAVDAGGSVAIDITLRNDTRTRYVVVDVPLPAGLEAVSRTLGRGRKASVLGGRRGYWVTHEEQRRDRVVLFADDLPPGTHVHTIDVRATSRGRYSFPPAQAEAMYMPEVYGRTVGATLEVR
jgi:uncharacterized protein YfaS (alpha-2-macroglobulin family)